MQKGILVKAQSIRHATGSREKILGPFHDNTKFPEIFRMKRACPAGRQDPPGRDHTYPGNPQQSFIVCLVYFNREEMGVGQGPAAFRIHTGIKIPVFFIQKLFCPESIESKQPVCLIEPVFPQQRGFYILSGKQRVFYHGYIGRIEHTFEPVLII